MKTTFLIYKERYIENPTKVTMKSVYIYTVGDQKSRSMTEQLGVRKTKHSVIGRKYKLLKN